MSLSPSSSRSTSVDQLAAATSVTVGASGSIVGFYGHAPAARPQVPAVPLAQDVVNALVALGLITQAP